MTKQEFFEKKIVDAIIALRLEVDSRMLFVALLANAAVIAEALIAAKVTNQQAIIDLYAQSCADALTEREREKPQPITMVDGDEPPGKMH